MDPEGRELYAGPNSDARGIFVSDLIEERVDLDEVYMVTGRAPAFLFSAARYVWFAEEAGAEVSRLLTLDGWLVYRMTGRALATRASASDTMLLDLRTGEWSEEIARAFGIPLEILPDLVDPRESVEELNEDASRELSVPPGTPVVSAGPDSQLAALGAGVTSAWEACAVLGTTAPVLEFVPDLILDPEGRTWTSTSVIPGLWVLESNAGLAGEVYESIVERLCGGDYDLAERLASSAPPGSEDSYCFLGPGPMDAKGMGRPPPRAVLMPPASPGASFLGPGEVVRCFMENLAYAIRANLEQLERVSGRRPQSVTLTGGLSRSKILPTLVASTLRRSVRVSRGPESTTLGCAAVAVSALNLTEFEEVLTSPLGARVVDPDPALEAEYKGRYHAWLRYYESLRGL